MNITKLVITDLLILLTIIDIGMAISKDDGNDVIFRVDYWTPVIKILTFVSIIANDNSVIFSHDMLIKSIVYTIDTR